MSSPLLFFVNGRVVLPDRVLDNGCAEVADGRIVRVGTSGETTLIGGQIIDLEGGYLVPGYVDLHVHGGDGADFMDGTDDAFRTTLVPAFANTIGPALFLGADRIIGGADGAFNRGMQWQGLSLRMTLHHEPTPWIPSSFMPTLPGRLFYVKDIAGPLEAECH